jgi:hypothetical protein
VWQVVDCSCRRRKLSSRVRCRPLASHRRCKPSTASSTAVVESRQPLSTVSHPPSQVVRCRKLSALFPVASLPPSSSSLAAGKSSALRRRRKPVCVIAKCWQHKFTPSTVIKTSGAFFHAIILLREIRRSSIASASRSVAAFWRPAGCSPPVSRTT